MAATTLLKFGTIPVLATLIFVFSIGDWEIRLSMNQLLLTVFLAILIGLLGFTWLTAWYINEGR